jgi:DNA-3-methyladenine glycosylase
VGEGFYARDTVGVARDLLGCILESRVGGVRTAGRIVEVEAYVGPNDPAAHGYGNRLTPRNAALFGPPGTCYVYFIYGMHWCFNAVTEHDGYPAAVLVRALEPTAGIAVMAERRGVDDTKILCAGPARLCQALGITGEVNARSMERGPVRVFRSRDGPPGDIVAGTRIGVSRARSWKLRFAVRGSPWLSRPIRR